MSASLTPKILFLLTLYLLSSAYGPLLSARADREKFRANLSHQTLPPVTFSNSGLVSLQFHVLLPKGFKLNRDAPSDLVIRNDSSIVNEISIHDTNTTLQIPTSSCENETLIIESSLFFCGEEDKICHIQSFQFTQPCTFDPQSTNTALSIEAPLSPKAL